MVARPAWASLPETSLARRAACGFRCRLGGGDIRGLGAGELGGPIPRPECSPGPAIARVLRSAPGHHRTLATEHAARRRTRGGRRPSSPATQAAKHMQSAQQSHPHPPPAPPSPSLHRPTRVHGLHTPPSSYPDVDTSARQVPVRGRPLPVSLPPCPPSSVTLSSCHTVAAPPHSRSGALVSPRVFLGML